MKATRCDSLILVRLFSIVILNAKDDRLLLVQLLLKTWQCVSRKLKETASNELQVMTFFLEIYGCCCELLQMCSFLQEFVVATFFDRLIYEYFALSFRFT
uniref:Secreted protein n=1 Tax=Parascaris univalens TaxID=6257 RepID=A0A915C0K5_PARUN